MIPLLLRFGELNYIKVETDKTVAAILKDLQVNQNYGLVQVHRDAGNSKKPIVSITVLITTFYRDYWEGHFEW